MSFLKLNTFLLFVFSTLSISLFSQDKIVTMSGESFECKIIDDTQIEFIYEITKKNGKTKRRSMHVSTIFSYTKDGEDFILYEKDIELGNWMSVEELEIFIQGEQDARENYNTRWIKIIGFTSSLGLTYVTQGSFLVPFVAPLLWTSFQLIPVIKIKEKYMSNVGYKFNDFYLRGFEPVARSKRVIDALKSGFLGSAAGAILFIVLPI